MTTVPATRFYEWPMNNDSAECVKCGKEMEVPDMDDINRDMKQPFWRKEKVDTYIGGNYDKFHAFCSSCYGKELSQLRRSNNHEQ